MSMSRYTTRSGTSAKPNRFSTQRRKAADSRPRDEREDVAVDQGDHAGSQRGQDLALHAIPEISGVQQVQGQRIERVAAFGALDAAARQLADERRSPVFTTA